MVIRLEGIVNGDNIIFQKEGEQWKAAVPANLKGEYVLEISAYDESGNKAYTTKHLFSYDPFSIVFKLMPLEYYLEVIENENYLEVIENEYYLEVIENENYSIKVIEAEKYKIDVVYPDRRSAYG